MPSARRLLLIKADGSVSVHADDRAYKPLNWMSPPCRLSEQHNGPMPVWVVENKAGEQLRITIESIEHDSSHDLGVDPGLVKDGVRLIEGVTHFDLYDRDQCVTPAVTKIDAFFRQHRSPTTASAPRWQRLEPIRD